VHGGGVVPLLTAVPVGVRSRCPRRQRAPHADKASALADGAARNQRTFHLGLLSPGIQLQLEVAPEWLLLFCDPQAIHDLCEVLLIELSAERKAAIHAMGSTELTVLRERLKRERRWP
jgi:hypothetical protein